MQSVQQHTILLGGVGGDAHSVGLQILRQSLSMSGYRVRYLGTQNSLADFFQLAPLCNVVMISTLDGHARHYLRDFPELKKQHPDQKPRWYLGGNLHIDDGVGYEQYFLDMGLDRVFVKFTDISTVLGILRRDLAGVEPVADYPTLWETFRPPQRQLSSAVSDEPLDPVAFEQARREVCQHWKTGARALDLLENAQFLGRQPSFPRAQAAVRAGRRKILIQPRSGVPLVDEQIKLFMMFKRLGIPVLSYQVDSLTRNNNYAGAEAAIRESQASGVATINGFPVVNHGVPALRKIISTVKVPLQVRHSTRDPRLMAEIAYAGGATAYEGGAICYNIPYYKDYPLSESIRAWQYVDYLTGLYYKRFGIVLDREFFGTLTATLLPPCLAIASDILESILAVEQGVKCVSLGYAEQGNRIQDIAAMRTLAEMSAEVLRNLGYNDVQVNAVFHQYMAAFPENYQRAEELIYNSAITAALSGATRVLTKSPAESARIPSLADNVRGVELAMQGVAAAAEERVDEARVAAECAIIRREVQAILDQVILCGRGSVAAGVVAAFQQGVLDIPFAPSIHARGEVMTARDVEGAVRFISTGHLPFDRELREFHEHKMQERVRAAGLRSIQQSYLLIEHDVLQIARGQFQSWPLS